MAMSGMAVDDECITQFTDMKTKHKTRYIIFKIDKAAGKVVIDKMGTQRCWKDFCEQLPDDDCRYAVYDVPVKTKDEGQATDKILMISW